MKNIKLITLILCSFLISISSYAGGGWPKKKGTYYVKVSAWYIEATENFTEAGDRESLLTSGLFNTNIYGEYGITDRLTAIAYIPFFTRSFQNKVIENGTLDPDFPGRSLNSFGDSEIGLKYGILRNRLLSWTGSITLGLPLGDSDSGFGQPLPTGDGEFNQILRSDLGISIYNSDSFSLYGNVYSGVNIRSKDFSEEYRGGVEVGAGLLDNKLWLVGKLDTTQSFNNGDRNFETSSGGSLFANNVEVTSLTPEIAYYITKKIGISASASFPLSGKQVYADPSYTGGIFIDIK